MSNDPNYLHDLGERVYEVNVANGWFEDDRRFAEDIALLHSEVSEALEAYRAWGVEDKTEAIREKDIRSVIAANPGMTYEADAESIDATMGLPKPEGVGSELADVLVRLLDTCKRHDIDLLWEFNRKLTYNATRGWKHGGKAL
jgi:NTP pyrophosphatase (non-canonical NTP hydrolase)